MIATCMHMCTHIFVVSFAAAQSPVPEGRQCFVKCNITLVIWFSDAPCPDDENNCTNNSYCYIYSVTGQSYCAQSCELNNGGCGIDQRCEMVRIQCFTDPCPAIVQCTPASEFVLIIVCLHLSTVYIYQQKFVIWWYMCVWFCSQLKL